MRNLIINGDDLGLCENVNRAIFELHERGIVTSASLMVDGTTAQDAVLTRRKKYPDLSLGIHFRFGKPPFNIGKLAEEMERQWNKFIHLTEHMPTHADIHQYSDIAIQLSRYLPERVPLRSLGSIQYIRKFNGENGEEAVGLANLIKLLRRIKKGVYEISCQPGYDPVKSDRDPEYDRLREKQLRTLLDERVRMILNMRKIELISYNDITENDQYRTYVLDRHYLS